MTEFILATDVRRADGAVALSAAVGVILALGQDSPRVLVVEVGRPTPLRATMLASRAARSLEEELHSSEGPLAGAVARGRVCFLALTDEVAALDALASAPALLGNQGALVASVAPEQWGPALARRDLHLTAALLRAELPVDRSLAALAVAELHERGLRVRVARQRLGTVPSRRARAGLDPGGPASSRVRRLARGLIGRPAFRSSAASSPVGEISEPAAGSSASEAPKAMRGSERGLLGADSGQVLPAVLLAAVVLIGLALAATAILGAVTGKGRQQRAADLIALSAARSMRDDFPRLFVAARRHDGSKDPFHLSKAAYLDRAGTAALEAASENSVGLGRVQVEFPDRESFAPVRARVRVVAGLDESESLGAGRSTGIGSRARSGRGQETPSSGSRPSGRGFEVVVSAIAEAVPMARGHGQAAPGPLAGGYQGSFASRQGKQMRPDVAAAFDALANSGRRAGFTLVINSAHRSDAHQAQLFARNPDPRWVAPPGRSLHRCGTELDLGPSAAYAWLAANAPEFGFLKRYSWEPWHFGFTAGPAPCAPAGVGGGTGAGVIEGALTTNAGEGRGGGRASFGRGRGGDGRTGGEAGLPAFVPSRFRAPIIAASRRWNVSAGLLAAQLLAESNFNPFAVSAAGAKGIAQFIPATAGAYGLDDPFDPGSAINAQARLMAELLERFGDLSLALAAYNAGPGPVAACRCVPPYSETRAYVARILGLASAAGDVVAPDLEVRLVS